MGAIAIIGTGISGMCAALEALKAGERVIMITKNYYHSKSYQWSSMGGCSWKTHAFNVATGENDSVESHAEDTFKGGEFAGNRELVDVLCSGAPALIDYIAGLGVEVDRNPDGTIKSRPFGGCEVARAVYKDDKLGYHITYGLVKALSQYDEDKLLILRNHRALVIHTSESTNSPTGITAINSHTLERILIPCNSVIISDGGGASMYSPTAASKDKTCDGLILALKLGLNLVDMEYVQFHPTGLVSRIGPFYGSLVEESLRFDGAKLINRQGERFMFNYHPKGETATRDQVARGIYQEIMNNNDFDNGGIKLDISDCYEIIEQKYPAMFERLGQAGYNVKEEPIIYIRPTAHFMMGGIVFNKDCSTAVPGVFVCGESAGGVHGANRLGGNGLTEALVFGQIAGKTASAYSSNQPRDTREIKRIGHFAWRNTGNESAEDILEYLRNVMYRQAGLIRNENDLEHIYGKLSIYEDKITYCNVGIGAQAAGRTDDLITLRNLLLISQIIVKSAIQRKESRGSHYRSDYGEHSSVENYKPIIRSAKDVNEEILGYF